MNSTPTVLRVPPRGRVLLLAPHADDEVLGAGGTLALHVEAGDEVEVLVAFDGLAGLAPELRASGGARVRREEALRGGAHLGVTRYEFWDYPEGHRPGPRELESAVERLCEHIGARAPQIVYAPWIGEEHVDHQVLSSVASRALARLGFRGGARAYEVWSPLEASWIVDVSRVWTRKLAALREHSSQLARTDLVRRMDELATHRGAFLEPGARYGEAFAPLVFSETLGGAR